MIALALSLSLASALPPLPPPIKPKLHSPKYSEHLSSLGTPMRTTAPPPPRSFYLAWDYRTHGQETVFEVWSSTNLTNWALWQTVPDPPVLLDLTGPSRFYIVRARDANTGLLGPWNIP